MATTATPKDKTREQLIKEAASLEMEVRLTKDQLIEARRNLEDAKNALINMRNTLLELEREKARLQGYAERVKEQDQNKLENVGRA